MLFAMEMRSVIRSRACQSVLLALIAISITLILGKPPSLFVVGSDKDQSKIERVVNAPLHLDDDVMISLRSGYMIRETGIPSFNRSDKAQPSTSYIAPYVYAALSGFFSGNVATLLYAVLGLMAVFFTFLIILKNSSSLINAGLMVFLLALSKTNLEFALNGWDHLFQALFLCFAVVVALKNQQTALSLLILSVVLSMGALYRPDGLLIALGIILAAMPVCENNKINVNKALLLIVPFVLVVGVVVYLNYKYFGYVTPTTARLKLGASPGLLYSFKYFLVNGFLSFSSITFIFVVSAFFVLMRKVISFDYRVYAIISSVALTLLITFFNSDVFPGARLYWVSATVLATLFALLSPRVFRFDLKGIVVLNADTPNQKHIKYLLGLIFTLFFVLTLVKGSVNAIYDNVEKGTITSKNSYDSYTGQQYLITKWIKANLSPSDGAIGFYWLGLAYHLPEFEAADFLGKADEVIAQSPVRWGPPGHNKWNEEVTLKKWNPQVIIPPGNTDPTRDGMTEYAQKAMSDRVPYAFAPSLIVNKSVNENYLYCYLDNGDLPYKDTWGFLVRKDIYLKQRDKLICNGV
ncbi:hypothetical protein HX792_06950 [Pseudomonas sp. B6002]|uniref:hypothetical protein n=1 Tax=Pseudomonas sp. B6002 TaxID=2726978 RepID=UPI0015A18100|nr:hypothetical protein [Pseudomonas sp. B6002]NVZ50065.1 hypothetical protein [Pseudomonas sp. B6002]